MARVSELQSTVARSLDLQSTGCGFVSRPRRCQATTLGKLFMTDLAISINSRMNIADGPDMIKDRFTDGTDW